MRCCVAVARRIAVHVQEMERELAVVRGQQAYLAATAGETAQALETFSQLLQLQLQADPATHAAVTNNVAVLLAQDGKGSVKVCSSPRPGAMHGSRCTKRHSSSACTVSCTTRACCRSDAVGC